MELLVTKHGEYPEVYSISSSQHPFISVLRSTPASWSLVLDQLFLILENEKPVIRDNALTMLRPVLLYLFCDPNYHLHFAAMRAILLDNLLNMSNKNVKVMQFLEEMIDLMKLDNKNSLQESAHYINKVLEWNTSHR